MEPTYLVMYRTDGAAIIVYDGNVYDEARAAFDATVIEHLPLPGAQPRGRVTIATVREDVEL